MSAATFILAIVAVFTGTTLAKVAAKALTDWLNRRAWRKMEMLVFTEATRIQGLRDAAVLEKRQARIKLIPKPKAH